MNATTGPYAALESLFLGLADKTRLRLLAIMSSRPASVGFLVEQLGESQPKISRHLAYLRNAGLVETQRDGKWIYYTVARPADEDSREVLRCVLDHLGGNRDGSRDAQPSAAYYEPEVIPDYEPEMHDHEPPPRRDELEIFLL